MLLAEDGLDMLMERLDALPRADRRAILRLLSERERGAVARYLTRPQPAPDVVPAFSAALADRLAEARNGADGAMTTATRAALVACAARLADGGADRPARGPSLFAALRAWLRRWA